MPVLEPLRRERLESTLGYYKQFIDLYRNDPNIEGQLAQAFRRVGEIANATGASREAAEAFQEAIRRYDALLRGQPSVVAHSWGLAGTLNELGLLQNELARPADAEASYKRALELLAELDRDHPGDTDYQLATARVYASLGVAHNALGRSADAARSLRRAIDLYDELSGEQRDFAGTRFYRSDVARAHYQLGIAQRAAGRLADAETSLRAACETYEGLIDEAPTAPTYRGNLARAYHDLGSLYRMTERPGDAEASHKRALALYQRVVIEKPTVAEYHMGVGWAHYKLGCHQFVTGHRSQAETNWAIAEAEFTTAAGMGFTIAGAYKALGDAQAMLGRWKEAADAYARVAEAYSFAAVPTLQWALLQLAAGDDAGHRATCSRLVREHAASAGGSLAASMVMTCVAGDSGSENAAIVLGLAQRIASADPRNPVGQVFFAAAQFRAGQGREAIGGLEAALPKLALAELAAPTKRDYVRLGRLAGETILALAYLEVGDQEALVRQLGALRATIDAIGARPPQYSDGTNEWTMPLALHIARRELERLESQPDPPDVK
jgi:tetratricopeptide (TPR) repeat protein